MDTIYGRSVPNTALDLLNSKKLETLITELKEEYDMIILDSPACLAVSDSRIITSLADQVLYAVHWNKTKRDAVVSGLKQYTAINAPPVAFVLTNVVLKKYINAGYGHLRYYYGETKRMIKT